MIQKYLSPGSSKSIIGIRYQNNVYKLKDKRSTGKYSKFFWINKTK